MHTFNSTIDFDPQQAPPMDLNGPEADQFCAWETGDHVLYECVLVLVAVKDLPDNIRHHNEDCDKAPARRVYQEFWMNNCCDGKFGRPVIFKRIQYLTASTWDSMKLVDSTPNLSDLRFE